MNHVVGKPVFIWMSLDNHSSGLVERIRWERLFTTVAGEGERVSYFQYFNLPCALVWISLFFKT